MIARVLRADRVALGYAGFGVAHGVMFGFFAYLEGFTAPVIAHGFFALLLLALAALIQRCAPIGLTCVDEEPVETDYWGGLTSPHRSVF